MMSLGIQTGSFWIMWVAAIVQRLFELNYSSKNRDRLRLSGYKRIDSSNSYRWMVGAHLFLFASSAIEVVFFSRSIPLICVFFFLLVFVCAQALRWWVFKSLGGHWNTQIMNPISSSTIGEESSVVTTGPYKFVKHPNYLAVILEFFSLPCLGGAFFSAITGSLWNGIVLTHRIKEEEEALSKRPGYLDLMGAKPRIIPFSPF